MSLTVFTVDYIIEVGFCTGCDPHEVLFIRKNQVLEHAVKVVKRL